MEKYFGVNTNAHNQYVIDDDSMDTFNMELVMREVYLIEGNDNVTFLTLEAAEEYFIENYAEEFSCKETCMDLCQTRIVIDEVQIN